MHSYIMPLVLFLLSAMLPAQWIEPAKAVKLESLAPVVTQTIESDLTVRTLHADGIVSLYSIDDEGTVIASFAGTNGSASKLVTGMQGPIGDEPVPMLRTSWCDEKGVTHEVVTPVISSTDAGIKKARELHKKLVQAEQADFPPKPCPPPPPAGP